MRPHLSLVLPLVLVACGGQSTPPPSSMATGGQGGEEPTPDAATATGGGAGSGTHASPDAAAQSGSGGTGGDDGGVASDDAAPPAEDAGPTGSTPLLALLPQFTAPDVPLRGPKESPPTPRSWTAPDTLPMQPGKGLAQHPFLYAGEGFNTLFLVNDGKVIWSYATAPGGEIDDVWMLSNAHVLYAHSDFLEELTPKKEVVWHYDLPAGTQCHSLQPIGLDQVLFVANGLPAKVIVMKKADNSIVSSHDLTDAGMTVHPQFRRIRMTAAGTIVAPYLEMRKVVEFDKDWKPIWTYPVADMGTPWTALRLHNGNTLIEDEHNRAAREVDPKGTIVWEFGPTDLPAGLVRNPPQTCERLANGNTVMLSPGKNINNVQAVEVTPAKQVVWVLQDWKDLGPATTAQFLDQPGIPEKPGDLLH